MREKVVKGHNVVQERSSAIVLKDLPSACIKESPADEHTQEEDDTAIAGELK
jgi:hypothetical protein